MGALWGRRSLLGLSTVSINGMVTGPGIRVPLAQRERERCLRPVSYTHLDVYKRQTQYIVGLIRFHLTKDPQLGMAELALLGESNRQLAAIGSNLNQIARQFNTNGGALQMENVVHLKREIDRHLTLVRNVMLANRERWTIR